MALKTLEYLSGISAEDCRRLREQGIHHSNQLLHHVTLEIDRQRLAARCGISPARLLEFGHYCSMLEISGMEAYLPTIRRLGITTLPQLQSQSTAVLHQKLIEILDPSATPSLSMVEYWISQARMCNIIEEGIAAPLS